MFSHAVAHLFWSTTNGASKCYMRETVVRRRENVIFLEEKFEWKNCARANDTATNERKIIKSPDDVTAWICVGDFFPFLCTFFIHSNYMFESINITFMFAFCSAKALTIFVINEI